MEKQAPEKLETKKQYKENLEMMSFCQYSRAGCGKLYLRSTHTIGRRCCRRRSPVHHSPRRRLCVILPIMGLRSQSFQLCL